MVMCSHLLNRKNESLTMTRMFLVLSMKGRLIRTFITCLLLVSCSQEEPKGFLSFSDPAMVGIHKQEIARQWDEEERQRAMSEAKESKKIDWDDPSVLMKSLPRKSIRGTVKRQKMDQETEKEDLKGYLDIFPREEFAEDVESLSTKYPIVDWKTCVLTENFMYYQVFRGDGSSKNYKVLSEMLEDFNRQYVMDLYRLVKERYSASRLEGYDLMLWGDLHTLFEYILSTARVS
ncbi:hypothetical protein Tco_0583154 [Tanacetum coccineum]